MAGCASTPGSRISDKDRSSATTYRRSTPGSGPNSDTAFIFGTRGFTGTTGELRVVDFGDGREAVYLDTNGDKSPEWIIGGISGHALVAVDFLL